MKHSYKLIGAFTGAALLAACAGNNGLTSSTPTLVTPPLAARGAGLPQSLRAQLFRAGLGRRIGSNIQKETVLHNFLDDTQDGDGLAPKADLTNVGGTLYGTTEFGGTHSCGSAYNTCGTVFTITTSGTESVLHSFAGQSDGQWPLAPLTNVGGTLYGTTSEGGAYFGGTVFKITTSGTMSVLYSFGAASGDGYLPKGGLTNVGGTLYGTTYDGGEGYCYYDSGCGTVFSVTTSGTERVLYRFAGGSDGASPEGGLTNMGGTLYGTTSGGGASGGGTVFKVSTSGTYNQLYSFAGGSDGWNPQAGLTKMDGVLYGTTYSGGANNYGVIFAVLKQGSEYVLYSFAGDYDGSNPFAGMIDVNGTLYGTTAVTVYSFSL
jgi:uncharacterized repeat protein (TIGR03803 family)